MLKSLVITPIIYILIMSSVFADKINKINIYGNERISEETVILFGEIDKNKDFDDNDLNLILKRLYKTDFFKDIKLEIKNNILNIYIVENPIVQSIEINGIKAKKQREPILESLRIKKNSSFIEYLAKKDVETITNILKTSGYYFVNVQLKKIDNPNNTVNLIYDIDKGKKAKIRKIKFIGDKKFKNRKLFRIIASEEDKFWKFISRNKLLNQSRIE